MSEELSDYVWDVGWPQKENLDKLLADDWEPFGMVYDSYLETILIGVKKLVLRKDVGKYAKYNS